MVPSWISTNRSSCLWATFEISTSLSHPRHRKCPPSNFYLFFAGCEMRQHRFDYRVGHVCLLSFWTIIRNSWRESKLNWSWLPAKPYTFLHKMAKSITNFTPHQLQNIPFGVAHSNNWRYNLICRRYPTPSPFTMLSSTYIVYSAVPVGDLGEESLAVSCTHWFLKRPYIICTEGIIQNSSQEWPFTSKLQRKYKIEFLHLKFPQTMKSIEL